MTASRLIYALPKAMWATAKYVLIVALRLILGTVQLALLLVALIALLLFLTALIVLPYVNRLYGRLGPSRLTAHLEGILFKMYGTVNATSKQATSSSGSGPVEGTSDLHESGLPKTMVN